MLAICLHGIFFSFFFDTSPNFKGPCQEIQITWTLLLDIMGQVAQSTETLLYLY